MYPRPSFQRFALGLPALLAALPAAASGQDVEVAGELHGVTPPSGYFEMVGEDPDFFEVARGWRARARTVTAQGQPLSGQLPVLVVQLLFADSPEPGFSSEEVQRVLFDGPSEHGTLTGYYAEVSNGHLEVDGEVTAWVRTSLTADEALGDNHGIGPDSRISEVMREALEAVDPLVDWERFNNDGPDGIPNSGDDDGYVDAVAFQFAERPANCGGAGPWPHRSRLSGWTGDPFETSGRTPGGDPIRVNDYIMQSTVDCDGDLQTPSTIAHELGHVLGLPDLYDRTEGLGPEDRRWVVGCWSLMSAGAWGCGDGAAPPSANRPPHMGAWEKVVLGWSPVEVVEDAVHEEIVLEPVRQGGAIVRVPLADAEHYLVEYREQAGYDVELPTDGVLIYHVDPERPVVPPVGEPQVYRVALVEADGNGALRRTAREGGNRGEAGDAFGAEALHHFNLSTSPPTRLKGPGYSSVTFHSIDVDEEEGVARIRITTRPIELERLLEPFLETGAADPLTEEEEALLDGFGNESGRYDLGDLRRYLMEVEGAAIQEAPEGP